MSLLDLLRHASARPSIKSAIPYGRQKRDGTHDHRTNRGQDRTPAQKHGDAKRRDGG